MNKGHFIQKDNGKSKSSHSLHWHGLGWERAEIELQECELNSVFEPSDIAHSEIRSCFIELWQSNLVENFISIKEDHCGKLDSGLKQNLLL